MINVLGLRLEAAKGCREPFGGRLEVGGKKIVYDVNWIFHFDVWFFLQSTSLFWQSHDNLLLFYSFLV